jgi:hypothetical protein
MCGSKLHPICNQTVVTASRVTAWGNTPRHFATKWSDGGCAFRQSIGAKMSSFARHLNASKSGFGVWIEPSLLAEIEYRAKSAEGKVRHPFFKDLGEDL